MAIKTSANDVRAELITDPDLVIEILNAFRIEICTRQVAAIGAFIGDTKWHFLIRIAQKHRFHAFNLAGFKIRLHAMEEQQCVRAVCFGAETIVGQGEDAAIGCTVHRKARHALYRLANEGKGDAGGVAAIGLADITHDGHRLVVAGLAGELAGNPRVARGIGRRCNQRQSWQISVTCQFCGKCLFSHC